LAVIALVFTLFIASAVFAQQKAGKDGVYEDLNFFDEAFERIRQDSVDSISDTKLIGAAISGMLTGLDPRSSFLDEAAFKATQNPANDNVAGVGMVVTIENGQLKVISRRDGSRAAISAICASPVSTVRPRRRSPTRFRFCGSAPATKCSGSFSICA